MIPETHAEPQLPTRRSAPTPAASDPKERDNLLSPRRSRRIARWALRSLLLLLILAAAGLLYARHWLRSAARESLPQLTGSLAVSGLHAPVTVLRDAHGIPSVHARSFDDLLFAQGFVTAGDRLFQMDTLRRHAGGELAEILGAKLVQHDRLQRTLALGPAADRILLELPADQRHALDCYAAGVNAAIEAARGHLPLEFRLLRYEPRPWTPRDSVLVSLILFEDLTNTFPQKLNREALTGRLAPAAGPELRAQLLTDLYPVGSWRDHPPSAPLVDLTTPVDQIPDIPLDDSQTQLHTPAVPRAEATASPDELLALTAALAPACPECRAGSNNWAVSGAHTASGKPLLANDMHLSLSAPGIWYAFDLAAEAGPASAARPFHAAGISLPGYPFLVVGHNDHVAWGFTNLGADVQDLYIEHGRGEGDATEFETSAGDWRPATHRTEVIHVRGAHDLSLDLLSVTHAGSPPSQPAELPIISGMLHSEPRALALRWTVYDTAGFSLPFGAVNSAVSGTDLVNAFRSYTGPAQNLVYADDAGHIGYHAIGRIPLRGPEEPPSTPEAAPAVTAHALSPVPTDSTAPDAAAHEWTGTIPFDQLPAILDPPSGIVATANARVTPDVYPFPITLNWADPYRNERIWRLLTGRTGLAVADMTSIQTDVYSEADYRLALRLAYAIDHSSRATKRLRAAADLLRGWNGEVAAGSPAAAIAEAAREALWPLLLSPKLAGQPAPPAGEALGGSAKAAPLSRLYTWSERAFAEEQIITHTPARWLPPGYANWDELLTAAVDQGLRDSDAPSDISRWSSGKKNPVEVESPLFAQLPLLGQILGLPTGTGSHPQAGNGLTLRQSRRSFGPSERFTADLAQPGSSTLVLPLGESGNPASPWFLDQFPAWLDRGSYPLPFRRVADGSELVLTPRR